METVGAMMEPGSPEWPRPSECRTSWTMSRPRPVPKAKVTADRQAVAWVSGG